MNISTPFFNASFTSWVALVTALVAVVGLIVAATRTRRLPVATAAITISLLVVGGELGYQMVAQATLIGQKIPFYVGVLVVVVCLESLKSLRWEHKAALWAAIFASLLCVARVMDFFLTESTALVIYTNILVIAIMAMVLWAGTRLVVDFARRRRVSRGYAAIGDVTFSKEDLERKYTDQP